MLLPIQKFTSDCITVNAPSLPNYSIMKYSASGPFIFCSCAIYSTTLIASARERIALLLRGRTANGSITCFLYSNEAGKHTQTKYYIYSIWELLVLVVVYLYIPIQQIYSIYIMIFIYLLQHISSHIIYCTCNKYIYIYTVESQPSTSYTTQYINHTSYTVISQQQI